MHTLQSVRAWDRFAAERLAHGRKILKAGYAPEAMEYARRGVTDSIRPAVWRILLGLPKVRRELPGKMHGRDDPR